MRKFLLMSAATLGLAVGPALAQTTPATPSPMPDTAPANPGMTGMRPMRGQQHETAGHHRAIPFLAKHGKAGSTHRTSASQAQDKGIGALCIGSYHGAGSLSST